MDKLHIRLKQAREDSGLTQKEISEMVGIHPPTWNKYESGKSGMNTETLFKVCKTLNVSADWLMGLTNEKGTHYIAATLEDRNTLKARGIAAKLTPRARYGSKKGIK